MASKVYVGFPTNAEVRNAIDEELAEICGLVYSSESPNPPEDTEAMLVAYSSGSGGGDSRPTGTFLAEWSRRLPKLRVIQTVSAGVDGLPFDSIPENVVVLSNAGAYAEPIAEHVFAMILYFYKDLRTNHELLVHGVFNQKTPTEELAGKVLGILGYGGIGRAIAKRAKCFGVTVHALNRSGRTDVYVDKMFSPDSLKEFLSGVDILVLTLPLTKHTAHMIDRLALDAMKEDAMLVNVGRAGVIVEEDLYNHLVRHPHFRAALDVWWDEPKGDSTFQTRYPFLSLPNVLGSPHNSGVVKNFFPRAVRSAAKNLAAFLGGKVYSNVVDRRDYV
ncbi:MAG: 2-hydroxyacid dehydrogenase [Thermoprotei archaeon]